MSDALTKISNGTRMLAEAKTAYDAIKIADAAEAYRYAMKVSGASEEAQREASMLKLRAERRAGELLVSMPKAAGPREGKGARSEAATALTYAEQGIDKRVAARCQKIASIPEERFEEFLSVADEITTAGVVKIAKEIDRFVELSDKAERGKNIRIDIDFRLGDFRKVLADLPDDSVDLILTDPPYPRDFIDLWSGLSEFAARVLKPGAFCIAYSGQANLPEVIKRMGEHLVYYWTFCLYHQGSTQIVNGVNVMCRWKPILLYQKQPRKKIPNTMQDYLISEGVQEKDDHEWQQTESGVGKLIELFSNPGDIVLDTFAGSGTTLKCARDAGRKPIGCEIDKDTYNRAKLRISS